MHFYQILYKGGKNFATQMGKISLIYQWFPKMVLKRKCPRKGTETIRIRKYNSQGSKSSIKDAINVCIHNGILVDYLERRGSEVVNMLTAEYDYDMDIMVKQEEAMEILGFSEEDRNALRKELEK